MLIEQIFSWEQYDLLSIDFNPLTKGLSFQVSDLKTKTNIFSKEILYFLSCFSVDGYTPAFVVDITLSKLDKQRAFSLMIEKGYQWMEPIDFPEYIWHLHIEGGVVIDAFSASDFQIIHVDQQNI
jgi:hypothetical protein